MHNIPPSPSDARGHRASSPGSGDATSPLREGAPLLEHLSVATADLDRLQRLLDESAQSLVTHFHAAASQMKLLRREVAARPDMNARSLEVAMDHLAAAISSMQFRDVATQLLEQVGQRLRICAGPLAEQPCAPEPCERATNFAETVPMIAEPGLRSAPEPSRASHAAAHTDAPA